MKLLKTEFPSPSKPLDPSEYQVAQVPFEGLPDLSPFTELVILQPQRCPDMVDDRVICIPKEVVMMKSMKLLKTKKSREERSQQPAVGAAKMKKMRRRKTRKKKSR